MTTTPDSHDPRVDPPHAASEFETLIGFLDYHRDTLMLKVDGLSPAQLQATHPPSTLTLGGLMAHLALVEDNWSGEVLLGADPVEPWASADWDGDSDWEMTTAAGKSVQQLQAQYAESRSRSDAVLRGLAASPTALDTLSARPSRRTGELFSLRWVILHLIEEYARHNGHADLIRESVDGVTGE
ncbi:DinB family protein [Allobranchiibius sp. GilTou38]|uniref:DinB family protein n=1 Tax=Allobranchiibius sp. GilTou38 TaxID=2815210 RepID=UPI001AA19011|nr:DinB family protein [Allobranchiibius sp. GilTou38]MBO1766858.1 DinB family protein [Allobranchiibius sp. GilTou38]